MRSWLLWGRNIPEDWSYPCQRFNFSLQPAPPPVIDGDYSVIMIIFSDNIPSLSQWKCTLIINERLCYGVLIQVWSGLIGWLSRDIMNVSLRSRLLDKLNHWYNLDPLIIQHSVLCTSNLMNQLVFIYISSFSPLQGAYIIYWKKSNRISGCGFVSF